MRYWAILNTITTKKLKTAGIAISQRLHRLAISIWNFLFLRDRAGESEPQVIKKYQNTVTQDMEEQIVSMYAKEMSVNGIKSHMKEFYRIDSNATIRIANKMSPIVNG